MLSFIVLIYNLLIFILLLIDLCTNNNEHNLIRFIIHLIWRLIIKLAKCCNNRKLKRAPNSNRNNYDRNPNLAIEMQTFEIER